MKEYQRDIAIAAKSAPKTERSEVHEQIDYKNELACKAIHLASIMIPIIYFHITKELALMLLVPMFLGFFVVDLAKMFVKPVADSTNILVRCFARMSWIQRNAISTAQPMSRLPLC
jgi:dolichol kinase